MSQARAEPTATSAGGGNVPERPAMTGRLTLLFAVAGGAAVGNLYLAQPLLDLIARDLHVSATVAGTLVTATQLGYAAGVLLLVPLGDVRNRRRLIPLMLLLVAACLAGCALAPSFGLLLAALVAVGATTIAGQLLVPLAGDLASDASRGRVVGAVASGILSGILLSRTISGLVAGAVGWRTLFAAAAVLDVLLAVVLYRALPTLAPREHLPYHRLLASVGQVIRAERAVRWTLVLGAIAFGTFTLLWTGLTFLLSAPPFNYSVTVIGLFGLAGLAGAAAAQRSGRLHDRGWNVPASGLAWALAIASFGLLFLTGHAVWLLLIVLVLFDIAVQTINILNQTRLFSVAPAARSRLNTAFVTCNFVAGAIGSALAGLLWTAGGWTAIAWAGLGLTSLGLVVWAIGRRSALVSR